MTRNSKTRSYQSPGRAASAEATHDRIVEAALGLLREGSVDRLTLDAVGKAAGVTRPTVYNQFGSRRALIESVFDAVARSSALTKIPDAMARSDPHEALKRFIGIFCEFWSSQPPLHYALERAGRGDQELEESLAARTERRRGGLAALVDRLAGASADEMARAGLVDLLFVLTSRATFAGLSRRDRDSAAVRVIIEAAALDAVRRMPS